VRRNGMVAWNEDPQDDKPKKPPKWVFKATADGLFYGAITVLLGFAIALLIWAVGSFIVTLL
jgi:hypothetical protein